MHLAKRLVNAVASRFARNTEVSSEDDNAYRIATESLLDATSPGKTPRELFAGVGDELWWWLYTEGCRRNPLIQSVLPSMPDPEVQLNFTGASGDIVLQEGFQAYRLFRRLYEHHVGPVDRATILDFGCGWGRIVRFWIRDVPVGQLFGCDPVPHMIELCRRTNRWVEFVHTPYWPPTELAPASFDLVYAFSVFSHLSEEAALAWLPELARILKPGGLLLLTTRGREFIQQMAHARDNPAQAPTHWAPRSSTKAFLDTHKALADFDAGHYCHTQLVTEGEWSYFGETAIPRAYAESHWPQHGLEVVGYVDDRAQCSQNVVVARKMTGRPD